jgi:HSP20 family molecular chaperone IbpA
LITLAYIKGETFMYISPLLQFKRHTFENFFNYWVNQTKISGSTFPFFDITQKGNNVRVDLALAGYSKDDVEVFVDNTEYLNVVGKVVKSTEKNDEEVPIFCGITKKHFHRKFYLGNDYSVERVSFKNGILSIYLNRLNPTNNNKLYEIEG